MTAPAPVQTKCECGHSRAAHPRGAACSGIDVVSSATGRRRIRAITLCPCQALHDTYTVPAPGRTRRVTA